VPALNTVSHQPVREARNPVKSYGVKSESWTRFRSGKFLVIFLDKEYYFEFFEFNVKSIIIQNPILKAFVKWLKK